MRKLPVWALRVGMEVARPVYDANGFMLLNRGVKLLPEYIEKLKLLQIYSVYIADSLIPDVEIEDIILDETRQRAKQLIRGIIQGAGSQQKNAPSLVIPKAGLSDLLNELISQLLANRNLSVNLADIRSSDDYTFAHSVNVAVLALVIGLAMGLSRGDLVKIGLGAFLHDIGKTCIPNKILNKPGSLTTEEMLQIKQHPVHGRNLLKGQAMVDPKAVKIIYQHHERSDGSGYPEGLNAVQMHLFAKIVAVADVYDALVADRPYRPAYLPHQALEILAAESDHFDPEVLQMFYRHLTAYPVGTVVGLSNGLIGVVVSNTVGYPTRPVVRVLCEEERLDNLVAPYELNLIENLDFVVQRVYPEEELADFSDQISRH